MILDCVSEILQFKIRSINMLFEGVANGILVIYKDMHERKRSVAGCWAQNIPADYP